MLHYRTYYRATVTFDDASGQLVARFLAGTRLNEVRSDSVAGLRGEFELAVDAHVAAHGGSVDAAVAHDMLEHTRDSLEASVRQARVLYDAACRVLNAPLDGLTVTSPLAQAVFGMAADLAAAGIVELPGGGGRHAG